MYSSKRFRKPVRAVLIGSLALLSHAAASAAVKTIVITPSADTQIKFDQVTTNFSAQNFTNMVAMKERIPLMRFPLTGVTANSTILSATLSLPFAAVSMPTTQFDVGVYNVCKPFDNGTVTYTNYATGKPWTSPGLAYGQDYFCGAAPFRGTRISDFPLAKTIDLSGFAVSSMQNKAASMDMVLLFEAGSQFGAATINDTLASDKTTWPSLTIVYDPTSPKANAGTPALITNLTVAPGSPGRQGTFYNMPLDGSQSSRVNGTTSGLSYLWTFDAVPAASHIATGTSAGTAAKITAYIDVPGDYTFRLRVTDPVTHEYGEATVTNTGWNLQSHPRLGLNSALITQIHQLAQSGDPAWTRYANWVAAAKVNPYFIYTNIGSPATALLLNYAVNKDLGAFSAAWQIYLPYIYNGGSPSGGLRPFYGSCSQANYCDGHDAAYQGGQLLAEIAQLYDWGYSALNASQRADLIAWINAAGLYFQTASPTFPFRNDGAIAAWGLEAATYATTGENSQAPQLLQLFRQRWAEINLALNVMGSGGALAEGNAYGSGTAYALINTANDIYFASGEDLFVSNPFFVNRLMYDAFTAYPRPLGEAGDLLAGDLTIEGAEVGGDDVRGPSWHTNLLRPNGLPLARHFPQTEAASVWQWVFRGLNPEPLSDPWVEIYYYYPKPALVKPTRLSWFDPGMGFVYIRSDWNSEDATFIASWAGPELDNHEHLDKGGFTVFKGQELTGSTGNYDLSTTLTPHALNYYTRSVAANTILVGDPLEQFGGFVEFAGCDPSNHWTFPVDDGSKSVCPANDGGQRTTSPLGLAPDTFADYQSNAGTYTTAKVTSFSDNSHSAQWVEDITNAYDNPAYMMPGSRAKVSSVLRKKVYLRDLDLLLVADIVTSTDPTFEKSVLLHSADQLVVGGSVTTVSPGEEIHTGTQDATIIVDNTQPTNTGQLAIDYRAGYSALLIHTVFPANPVYHLVGGRNPSPVDHQENGQSNPQVLAQYHLHTHVKDYWVRDYSEGYLPDHASSNWSPIFPPEMNYTAYTSSVVGGYGHWRLEIQPSAPSKMDYFLNVMKPTRDQTAVMPPMTPMDQGSVFGVTITANGHSYAVSFTKNDSGAPTVSIF